MFTAVSYNGLKLNTPDLVTVIEERRNKKLQADVTIKPVANGPFPPQYPGIKELGPRYINLTCVPLVDVVDTTQTLIQYFRTPDLELHDLVLMDTSGKRWVCQATCYNHEITDDASVIGMMIPDGLIYAEDANSHSWSVTASGQTETVTVGGNYPTRPVITVTPTSAKNSGYVGYKRFSRWYNPLSAQLYRYPWEVTGGGLNTAALVNYTAVSNKINKVGGIGASDDTIPIDTAVGGGLPSEGMGYVGTEQIKWTGQSGGQLTGVTRGIGGTSAATHADNAVIALSKVLANGDDLLVYLDGNEYARWLSGMNTTTTKVWTSITWKAGISATLGAALSTGALTKITFASTTANTTALQKLPTSGYLRFDDEIIYYGALDIANKQVTGILRAQMGTSQATHALGTAGRWVEHEILLTYGDKDADSPVYTNNSVKPLIDLANSTNTSWVWADFSSAASTRPFEWQGAVIASTGGKSAVYSGSQGAFDDPATQMGMLAQVWQQAGLWKGETAELEWRLNNPCGFTTITVTGEKYRKYAAWLLPKCQKSNDGINWTTVFTEATPASADTWGALDSHSAVSLSGTYKWLRFYMSGSLAATANNANGFAVKDLTGVIASANVPQGSLGSEVTTAYSLRLTFTNSTDGSKFIGRFMCKVNDAIEIDCQARTITNLTTGANLLGGKDMPPALDWFTLAPGKNPVRFVDVGTTGVSMRLDWQEYV